MFSYGVEIINTSKVDVTITSLADKPYGDVALIAGTTCSTPQVINPGASYSCSFSGEFSGNAGDTLTDTITAAGTDIHGNAVTANASATVTLTDAPPAISVSKAADVSKIAEPGGDVTYTVAVTNTVEEPLALIGIVDDKFGDLDASGNGRVSQNGCANKVGTTIASGATFSCAFTARVEGSAGQKHVNTVTVSAADDDGAGSTSAGIKPAANVVKSSASATVTIVAAEVKAALPPTDMLVPTSASGPSGTGGLGLSMVWALWALLSATLIVMGGWVIREQRHRT